VKNEGQSCRHVCDENSHCPNFCGKHGHCCKKGIREKECSGAVGGKGVFKCAGIFPDVKNQGHKCWEECGEQNGHCPGFCGRYGYCCKRKVISDGCDGEMGGHGGSNKINGYHTCDVSSDKIEDVTNEDETCWGKCGKKGGYCPNFCGRHGYCCKKGKIEDGCDGERGREDHHRCVGYVPDVKNEFKPCSDDCGENGYCPSFCGQDGLCCMKGVKENGCDGTVGGNGERVCIGRIGRLMPLTPVSSIIT